MDYILREEAIMKTLIALSAAVILFAACCANMPAPAPQQAAPQEGNIIHAPLSEMLEMSPVFEKVKPFLATFDATTPDGTYNIDGDKIFAAVSRYNTKPEEEVLMESHRFHSEIHYLLSGEELFGYADIENLTEATPYDDASDVEFWHNPAQFGKYLLDGNYAVFLDVNASHAPKIMQGNEPKHVVKVVVKFHKDVLEQL